MTSDKFGHPTYEEVLNTWTQERVNDCHALLDMFEDYERQKAKEAEAARAAK